jgi:hypothetical protein
MHIHQQIIGNMSLKLELNPAATEILSKIKYFLEYIMQGNSFWDNEFGHIDVDNQMSFDNTPSYKSIEDVAIKIFEIDNVVYFKIFPKDLKNPTYDKYDGYFIEGLLDESKKDESKQKMKLDNRCIRTTRLIDSYMFYKIVDEYKPLEKPIHMYFTY